MLWEKAPVVSVIHLFLTPVADKLMKLGCQGVTRVTQLIIILMRQNN